MNRTPNFAGNMLKAKKGERPERATLFELYLSTNQIERLSQIPCPGDTPTDRLHMNFKKITGTAILRR